MPADERPREHQEPLEQTQEELTRPAIDDSSDERKERSGAQVAAAGLAGAAVVGTAAGAAVAGAARAADMFGDDEAAASGDDATAGTSLDVFSDIATSSDDASPQEDPAEVAGGTAPRTTTVSQPLAPVGEDDNRKGQQRNDPNTPSAVSDATVIAAHETGSAAVTPTPVFSRPRQQEEQPQTETVSQQQAPAGTGFDAGSQSAPAAPAQPQTPSSQVQPVSQETSASSSSSSPGSSGIDVIQDVAPSTSESSSSSESSSAASSAEVEEIVPTGPAEVPATESVAAAPGSGSSSGSSSTSESTAGESSGAQHGDAHDDQPGYGMQYPEQDQEHAEPPAYPQQPDPAYADPGYQQPDHGHKPPVQDAGNQQQDQGYDGHQPPVYKPKPPVHAKDDEQEAPPFYHDDQQDDYVEDDYVEDDYVEDDAVEEPVYYDPYYAPFPGDKGYGHPQDLYGDPQPPAEGQAPNVYVYRGPAGEDYATIIRDEYGNETITWWYGDPPNGHVVYEVRVTHDGYGNYTEQITSYPVYEVDLLLEGISPNGEQRMDPDFDPGKQYAEEVIDQHMVTRTWTDEDGNLVIKKMYRDGSGKIEITYGDGLHVVYQGGQYAYYMDGELIDGEEYVVEEPDDDYAGNNLHPLAYGPDYFVEEGFVNPLKAGYEAIGEGDSVQYVNPETGARMFVTKTGEYEYSLGWQTDPNAPPGQYELLVKVQVDANGHYVDYNTTYYTGDVVVVDTIPNLGYQSVNGEQYLDPYQEYGFPADNASQVVTEETVVQTWQTPEGPITKTYYRDGSHKTVTEYADGVVITYDTSVSPYPYHDGPVGEPVDAGEIMYYEAGLFGDTYADPSGKFPDGPAGTFDENGIQTDYYPDGTRVQHYPDHQRITWYDAQGNVMLGVSVYDNGYQVDVLPWDYVLDTYGVILEPIQTSHGMYSDPESTGAAYEQEVMYGAIKHTYPDGTEKIYLTGAQGPGWIQINYPDGTIVVWNGSSIDSVMEGTGEFATPVEGDDVDDGPPFVMGGPAQFMAADGVYFDNPEYDNEYTFSHASPDGMTLFFVDSTGYQAVIQNMGGSYTVFYGPNPPAQTDMVVSVQSDGSYTVQYYPAGEDAGEDEEALPVQTLPILEELPFSFNDLLPDRSPLEPEVPQPPSPDPVAGQVDPADLKVTNPIVGQVGSFTGQPGQVYPRVVNWNDSGSNGWVVMEMEDGTLLEHRIGDSNTYQWFSDSGVPSVVGQGGSQLLYVTSNGTAYFQTDSSQSSFYMVTQNGGQTQVGYADLPFVLPGDAPVFEAVEPEPESVGVVVQPPTFGETVGEAVGEAVNQAVDEAGQSLIDNVVMPVAEANKAIWDFGEEVTGVDLVGMIPDDMPGKLPAPSVDSLYPDGVPPDVADDDDDGDGSM